jgi:small subunit ribosomal protein S1
VGRGKGGDLLRMRELQSAHEGKIPVPGKVRSTNKGGFEIDLGGVRAFCPFSQIDTIYCENPEEHLSKEYPFEIITFERGGRNIVVSRRGLIEAEQKEKAKTTRESIEVGAVIQGKVRRIQPYGAFVDIGGLDGLVHVSEISQAHIRNPKDILTVGQEVEVKVVSVDGLGTRKERVSLSMKALAPDPWDGAADRWKVGTSATGRVVRLTDFGAFVELAPGVDGLVHVSQISTERIGHPSDVLSPNQEVEVRILDLDVSAHRISLTMRPEGEEGESRGGGGFRSRRPPRERSPMEYSSSASEKTEDERVDVSDMEYDDAVAALKKKFEQ